MGFKFLTAGILCLLWSSVSFATPYHLSYVGRLTEANGKPIAGPVDLRVTFFRSASNNDQVAVTLADFAGIALTDGLFQISINLSATEFHTLFNGIDPVFIQVEDLSHAVTYPRQQFSTVPYALKVPVDGESITFNAAGQLSLGHGSNILKLPNTAGAANKVLKSDGAGGLVWADDLSGGGAGSITGTEIQDGSITNADISAMAAIATSKISGLGSLATKSAVDSSDIADGSVTGTDIANGTITDADINATAAISHLKISGLGGAASKNVGTGASDVAAGNHGHVMGDVSGLGSLAAKNAVDSADITDGSIMNGDINVNAAIASSKIAGLGTAATKDVGSAANEVAAGNHSHADATTGASGFMSAGDKVRLNAAVVTTDTGSVTNTMIADGAVSLAKLSATICAADQVLKMNSGGTALTCATDAGSGSYSAKSSDYTVTTSDNGKLLSVTNQTTITLPAAATAGAGFKVIVKRSGSALVRIMPSGAETIDGQGVGVMLLTTNASVDLMSSGAGWVIASKDGFYVRSSSFSDLTCGGSGDNCYSDANAKAAGYAHTPNGKALEYVTTTSGFQVWKELGGLRVLKPDGSDNWAMKLNSNGKGFSAEAFVAWLNLTGRVCPTNVYIDDSNKFTTGNCLYYTSDLSQALHANGTDGISGISAWATAKWYVGNIKICSDKGMRLPALFETSTTTITHANHPTSDGSPTFAQSSGVPMSTHTYTWTASSETNSTNNYWLWPTAASSHYNGALTNPGVRCVLP